MNKGMRSRIFILLTILSLFTFSGCRSFFIAQDKPILMEARYRQNQSRQEKVKINAYQSIGRGVVQDISDDGSSLLLLNTSAAPPINYSMEMVQIDDGSNRMISLVTSEKRQLRMHFDNALKGVFYTVENEFAGKSGKFYNQLSWTSIDKSATRMISDAEESVNSQFFTYDNQKVVYTNEKNEIIFADAEGNRQVYHLEGNLTLGSTIAFLPEKNIIIFMGTDIDKEPQANLYSATVNDNSNTLSPKTIDKNILNFDFNPETGEIIYIKFYNSTRQMISANANDDQNNKKIISTGDFTSAVFSSVNDKIIYTQYSPQGLRSNQSIWIMDKNAQNKIQLTSPLSLSSTIIVPPKETALYFSVEEQVSDTLGEPQTRQTSQIYRIDYTINE